MLVKHLRKDKKFTRELTFEVRGIDEAQGIVKGYASVFNVVDSYGTCIKPGAFKESIDKRGTSGIRVLWNHNHNEVIGVPLVVKEDEIGLYVEFKIVKGVQRAEETFLLIQAGAVDAFSIGFMILADEWDRDNNIINITKVDLWEFSPVTFPANKLALVTDVRSEAGADEPDIVETEEVTESEELVEALRSVNAELELKNELSKLTRLVSDVNKKGE